MARSLEQCPALRCSAGEEITLNLGGVTLTPNCGSNLYVVDGPTGMGSQPPGTAVGPVDFTENTVTFSATEPGCYILRVASCCPTD